MLQAWQALPELLADIARSGHGVNDDAVRGRQPAGPEHLDEEHIDEE